METTNTELEENLSKLDEDRSDIIAYLKKALQQKTNELVELQERLDGLKQVGSNAHYLSLYLYTVLDVNIICSPWTAV